MCRKNEGRKVEGKCVLSDVSEKAGALRKYGLRGGRNGRKPVKTADKSCQIYNTPLGILIVDKYLLGITGIICGYHYKIARYYKKMAGYYNNFWGWTR